MRIIGQKNREENGYLKCINGYGTKVFKLFLLAQILLILNGCGGNVHLSLQGDEKMRYEMSREEKDFLKKMYMDEDRIEEGGLYSYQEKMLLQYRFLIEYLSEKYPDYSFKILGGEPENAVNACASFSFSEKDGETVFRAQVIQEKGEWIGEDNFYGEMIREPYDAYIYENCKEKLHLLGGVYSIITGVKGSDYNEKLTVEEIVSGEKEISPLTEIYLKGMSITEEEWEKEAALVEKELRSLQLYGSYIVYYITDYSETGVDGKGYHEYIKGNDYLYRYSFQIFNR